MIYKKLNLKAYLYNTLLIPLFAVNFCIAQNTWYQDSKLEPIPYLANTNDELGASVAISKEYIVIGAKNYKGKGCVYVLSNNSFYDTLAVLEASSDQFIDEFGCSVDIYDSVIVVGAKGANDNGFLSGAAYVFVKPESGWINMTETVRLTPIDASPGQYFGISVAIQKNTIAVGAKGDRKSKGAVYLFEKAVSGWKDTKETTKLVSSDGQEGDNFGVSIDFGFETIVIGAYTQNGKGAAYLYVKPKSGWQKMKETAKFTASDGQIGDMFGTSISIDNNTIVVGAREKGAVYIFLKSNLGWIDANENAKLTASDYNKKDQFGNSVCIEDSTIIVGAQYAGEKLEGAAYLFKKPKNGWSSITETAKLTTADAKSNANLGSAVDIHDSKIAVGAYHDEENGQNSGSVYLYEKSTNGWESVTETKKITAWNPYLTNGRDIFGYDIVVTNDIIVVGTNTSLKERVYVIENNTPYDTLAILTASDGDRDVYFGSAISANDSVIVVGAKGDDTFGSNSGSAYVYVKPKSGWRSMTETAKLNASDGMNDDGFGTSVSLDSNAIVIGACSYNTTGSAYIYIKPESGWKDTTESCKLSASDGSKSDCFGTAVCVKNNIIVIGASGDDDNGDLSGSAYLFIRPESGWKNSYENLKILPSNGSSNNRFGCSIDISSTMVVIGSYGYDDYKGAAYVFERSDSEWEQITEVSRLEASNSGSHNEFGRSININDNTIVVGARFNNSANYIIQSGSAYIFKKPNTGWSNMTENYRLKLNGDGDFFGQSVGFFNETVVVGAPYADDNGESSGTAYVFKPCETNYDTINASTCNKYYSPSGKYIWDSAGIYQDTLTNSLGCENIITVYLDVYPCNYDTVGITQVTKLLPVPYLANNYDNFGNSVLLTNEYIIVGASNYKSKGGVYILSNNDKADTIAVLTASDGSTGDNFGHSVAYSNNTILVGAINDDDNGSASGSAYIFVKPESGWVSTTETAKLLASDGANEDKFGWSVSIDNGTAIIGAHRNDELGTFCGAAYVFERPVHGWSDTIETAKLLPSDGEAYDYFGHSVDIESNTIVIGAYGNDDLGYRSGSAYIFEKPLSGWENMTESVKLLASQGKERDNFGYSVAIEDTIIVIGAPHEYQDGTAYVFIKAASGWLNALERAILTSYQTSNQNLFGSTVVIENNIIAVGAYRDGCAFIYQGSVSGWKTMYETTKINSPQSEINFGRSIDILGNTIAFGTTGDDENGVNSGAIYLYSINNDEYLSINEEKKVFVKNPYLTNAGDNFGRSVSMSDNFISVGSNYSNTGNVYVFSNNNPYDTIAILTASDGISGDNFGHSIAMNDSLIVVGAPGADNNRGSVYVFEKSPLGWQSMTESAKLESSRRESNDNFGTSVSFSNNTILIGSKTNYDKKSVAYIFEKPKTGWTNMTETAVLSASDGANLDYFGYSVSINNDEAIVGAYGHNTDYNSSGAAYVFIKPESGWKNMSETIKIIATDRNSYQHFGISVGISDSLIAIGTPGDDDNGNRSGSVYIYEKPNTGWGNNIKGTLKLKAPDASSNDQFGNKVSIYKANIVVGAYNKNEGNNKSGAVYFYKKPELGWTNSIKATKISNKDISNYRYFGNSIGIGKNKIAISVVSADMEGTDGAVYIYKYGENIDTSINLKDNTLFANAIEASYQWLNCNTKLEITGETNQSYTPTESGDYAVIIKKNGVIDTSNCYSVVLSDINHNKLENRINVYPNPTSGELNIEFNQNYKKIGLEIITLTGQLVQKENFINTNKISIEIKAHPGIYFVSISTDSLKNEIFKAIVE